VIDHAAIGGDVQAAVAVDFGAMAVAVERLGAAAADEQRLVARVRGHDLLAELGQDEFHGGDQKRGMSGKRSSPPCTCILPYSAQRASVGMTFSGLSSPRGSKARLTARNRSSSSRENCTHIWLIFSMPTPCSPVTVPPTCTQSSRMAAPNFSARSTSSGLLESNRISGCRLPSPA